MKPKLLAIVAAVALVGVSAIAAPPAPSTYQVTGPIVSVTGDVITITAVRDQNRKWEIAKDPNTKGVDLLKVGTTLTITYRMTATAIAAPGK